MTRDAKARLREAVALHQAGRPQAAAALYREVLTDAPDNADAHHLLGLVEAEGGDMAQARTHLERAVALKPDTPLFLANLGQLHQRQGETGAALKRYRQAAQLAPQEPETALALSRLLRTTGRAGESREILAPALAASPENAALRLEAAEVAQILGRPRSAIGHLKRALAAGAAASPCWTAIATTLAQAGRHGAARRACARALAADPDNIVAKWIELRLARLLCDWRDDDTATIEEIVAAIGTGRLQVQPFALLSLTETPAPHRRAAESWIARHAPTARPGFTYRAVREHKPLRVGYLSNEFREHAMGWLLAGLFKRHNRERVAPLGYSYGPDDGSAIAQRLREGFEGFVDIRALGHHAAAERIHRDRIDILVDLKGHTVGARPGILAQRPAPLQVNWLGYPGTSGAPYLDYIVADGTVIPPGDEHFFSEAVVRLPHCYQVTDPERSIASRPSTRAACNLPEEGFVFCCFNATHKIGPEIFHRWMALLREIEGSCLWLLDGPAETKSNLRLTLSNAGLDPGRLVFAERLPQGEHLARHRLADLFLDTLPYGAHTTASDALWVGLPVLTCQGASFPARVGASLLRAVGLPDLITQNLDDYQALAHRLARDPGELGRLRKVLAASRSRMPLFDCTGFARDLERAYEIMWAKLAAGEPVAGFEVSDR